MKVPIWIRRALLVPFIFAIVLPVVCLCLAKIIAAEATVAIEYVAEHWLLPACDWLLWSSEKEAAR